jgi:hypothetical protein
MPRENGWLKADALKTAGVKEQWAKDDGVQSHEVSLFHDTRQGGYVVQHVIVTWSTLVRETHAWQVGENLPFARQLFSRTVRSLGGKA